MPWNKDNKLADLRSCHRWHLLRESVLVEQLGLCFFCGSIAEVVHHIEMATRENYFERSNLVGLCCKCHLRVHAAYGIGITFDDLKKQKEVNNAGR